MKDYRGHVQTAKDNVDNLDIKPEEKAFVAAVLGKVLAFMDTCLKNGTFDPSKGTGPKSFDDLHKAGLL
jgi:hypothetical protein